MKNKWRRVVGGVVLASALTRLSISAPADESGAGATTELEEITVTAQKRTEDLQKAATSVSVYSGEALQNMGISNVLQLSDLVPASRFNSENTEMKLFVRGVGTDPGFPWIPESVSVFINGGFLQRFGAVASFFDLESAQTLPGPQGTLYGRNSIGGTIQLTTALPKKEYEAHFLLEAGNYNLVHGLATLNLPIGSTLAVRAAFNYETHSGYQTNGADSEGSYAGRLSALWSPSEQFDALVWAQYWQNNFHSAVWQNLPYPNPDNPWYVPNTAPSFAGLPGIDNLQPLSHAHTTMVGGKFDFHFADMTLSYIPFGYNFNSDEHRPVDGFLIPWKLKIYEYSQELRLANNPSDIINWVGGLTWLNSNGNLSYLFGPNLAGYDGHINLSSYAAYGQATVSITNWLRDTVGLRYSWDQVSAPGSSLISPDATLSPVYTPFSFSHNWHHLDWKEGVEADLGEHSMAYGSVQTGYTAGTYNTIPASAGFSSEVSPQTLLAFTVGIKNRFLDNRLQVNNEIFYYKYHNLLLAAFSGATGQATIYNANRSTILGDQLDVAIQATASDKLTAGIGFLHAKIRDFVTDTGVSYDGYTLPNAPTYTAHLAWDHNWNLGNGDAVKFHVNSLLSQGYWALYSHDAYTNQRAYTKTDVSVNYEAKSGWSVGIWGRNLENVATLAAAGAGGLPGPSASYIDPPRTYGVRLETKF